MYVFIIYPSLPFNFTVFYVSSCTSLLNIFQGLVPRVANECFKYGVQREEMYIDAMLGLPTGNEV